MAAYIDRDAFIAEQRQLCHGKRRRNTLYGGGLTMYDELISALREEAEWAEANEWETPIMLSDHLKQAADAIDELMRFAHFVAREVVVSDEEWESNECAFPEIASRKLHKIGIVEKDGAFWHYEPPKEE